MRCPNCEFENPNEMKSCKQCNYPLKYPSKLTAQDERLMSTTEAEEPTKKGKLTAGLSFGKVIMEFVAALGSLLALIGIKPVHQNGKPRPDIVKNYEAPTKEEIALVQTLLKEAGYDPGPIDGKLGPLTKAALRSFQQARKLSMTGKIDRETVENLTKGSKTNQ